MRRSQHIQISEPHTPTSFSNCDSINLQWMMSAPADSIEWKILSVLCVSRSNSSASTRVFSRNLLGFCVLHFSCKIFLFERSWLQSYTLYSSLSRHIAHTSLHSAFSISGAVITPFKPHSIFRSESHSQSTLFFIPYENANTIPRHPCFGCSSTHLFRSYVCLTRWKKSTKDLMERSTLIVVTPGFDSNLIS